jgi:ribosomal protein S18 acetylase RimI-like enzyme
MDIRPVAPSDAGALRAFFTRVPEGDRTFFREDVFAPDVIEGWFRGTDGHRYVAADGREVAGYLAIVALVGWSRHVAEIRVIVDPGHRRQGVGRALARHGLVEALHLGFAKLVVEVVADQEPTLAMFSTLGFQPEALLRDHVRDGDGTAYDLIVMSHFVEDNWSAMQAVGFEESLD